MALYRLLLFALFLALITACSQTNDPVPLTVEARQTQTAVAFAVDATMVAAQPTPTFNIADIETISLQLEGTASRAGGEASFFGGEAIFRSRGITQAPDMYFTYRLPEFVDDIAYLTLDGRVYLRRSRFEAWTQAGLRPDLGLFSGMSPVQAATNLFGFTLSLEDWEQVGVETLDERETIHYRRTYIPNNEVWQRIAGIDSVERVNLNLWVSSADNLPRRLDAEVQAHITAADTLTTIQLTINVTGYNEPISFPSLS